MPNSNRNKQTTVIHNNMEESHKCNIEQKKPDTKKYIMYDSV